MSKSTTPVRRADGATDTLVAELLNGAKHLIQHVATAIPTVVSCQQATVGTSAVTLASLLASTIIPANATHALVRANTGNSGIVRWWDDGTSPTATAGIELAAGDMVEWVSLSSVKVIGTAAGQVLNISFRRYDA